MKRDADLIRLLLLLEEGDRAAIEEFRQRYPSPPTEDYVVAHHVALLIDAGMIEGTVSYDRFHSPVGYEMIRLTWAGCEMLGIIRHEAVWQRANAGVIQPDASWSFAILLEVATAEARQQVGLS